MGYYIDRLPSREFLPPIGKANELLKIKGAREVDGSKWETDLVCVISNGSFDAAGFCFNEEEYKAFADPSDPRRRRWLVIPNAAELARYTRG